MAVMRSGSGRRASDDICAPLDMPVEKTWAVSMQSVDFEIVE